MIGQRVGLGVTVSTFGAGLASSFGATLKGTGNTATGTARGLGFLQSQVWGLGKSLMAVGTGAAIAAVTSLSALGAAGISLNKDLESMRLGMTATIGANMAFKDSFGQTLNASRSFQESMKLSGRLVSDFEARALKLPGSSTELANLFSAALNPALSAGKTVEEITNLSASAMTFAKVIKNDMPQASRDLQMLLSGSAGIDNRTWALLNSTIGMTAEQFNKLPAPEKFDRLQKAFTQFATPEVVNAYANSWDGLTSSFQDLIDQGTRAFGAPLFKELKSLLSGSITFLTDNRAAVHSFATALGTTFAAGLRGAVNLGMKFGEMLGSVWSRVQGILPSGKQLNGWLDGFLSRTEGAIVGFVTVGATLIKVFAPLGQVVGDVVAKGFDLISNWISENQGTIDQVATGITKFGMQASNVFQQVKTGVGQFSNGVMGLWNQVKVFLPTGDQMNTWAVGTWETINQAAAGLLDFGKVIWGEVQPIVTMFTDLAAKGFQLVSGWLNDNQEKIGEAQEGFNAFVGVVASFIPPIKEGIKWGAKFLAWGAGVIALGLGATIAGITRVVIELFANFRKGLAFVQTLPQRVLNSFDELKLGLLRWGMSTFETLKQNPVFGTILGWGDAGTGFSVGMNQTMRDLDKSIQRRQLEIQMADPTDPRMQYQASRLLGNMDNSQQTTVNQTFNIQSNDPETVGRVVSRAEAQGVKAATEKPDRGASLGALTPAY